MKSVLVLRHQHDVPMGSLPAALASAGLEPRQLDLYESVPENLPWNEAAGLIVLGGSMSANDGKDFPFLIAELDWLREATRRQLPTLGICLGAQLLAKALGCKVYRNVKPEIGWHQMTLLPAASDDRLLQGRAADETVFQWHNDTFDLPEGAIHLAATETCRNQVFRYGDAAYGLQFHVEMEPELMELWLTKLEEGRSACDPDDADAEAIRAGAAGGFPAMSSFSDCLLQRFASLCEERA